MVQAVAVDDLKNCPNKSEYIYGWAGKLMHACADHTNAMSAISNVMGAPFSAEPDVHGMAIGRMCEHKDDLQKESEE